MRSDIKIDILFDVGIEVLGQKKKGMEKIIGGFVLSDALELSSVSCYVTGIFLDGCQISWPIFCHAHCLQGRCSFLAIVIDTLKEKKSKWWNKQNKKKKKRNIRLWQKKMMLLEKKKEKDCILAYRTQICASHVI